MRKPAPVWALCLLAATAAAVAAAQQVTLPLSQYEELRSRANPAPDVPPEPPAPFALESADFDVQAGAASARITQTLVLTLYADGWQRVPLGEAGSFTTAHFGDLDGRVEVKDDGWALQVKGKGRHEVKLESVVPVQRDETAIRPAWSFQLRFPPAAVVRGRLQAPAEVEEVEITGAGLVRRGASRNDWSFVAAFDKEGSGFTLYGKRTLPARAQLPLRFDATSATSAVLSWSQLKVHGWIEARVAQGRLEVLKVPLPAGLKLVSVDGPLAGWNVEQGTLVATTLAPVESTLGIFLEFEGDPPKVFTSPLLLPEGSRRTLVLTRAALKGDGLLTLADPDAVRTPEDAETSPLPPAVRGAGGRLFAVLDPARPPRWEIEWAQKTGVLAAQVDRLLVDVALGVSGRAAYQLWAEIRNRGAQQLVITLPSGFELVAAERDGETVAVGTMGTPGTPGGGLSVPLQSSENTQVVHLSGFLPLALPDRGDLQVPLPALSAPAARVELRLLLPGDREATLADPTRAAAVNPPYLVGDRDEAAAANALAKQVLANTRKAGRAADSGLFPAPPGFRLLSAGWNALSANPLPLTIRIKTEKEGASWF